MAVMGVRMNSGGGGFNIDTGVADVFAKALFGDPEREMKLALQRSDLELDKYRQQQLESVVAHNNALTELERYKLQGRQGVVPALAKILAGGAQGGGGDASTAPAPVPVETPIPVPTPRPALASDQPVPVEPDFRISDYPLRPTGQAPEQPFRSVDPVTRQIMGQTPEQPFRDVAPVPVTEPGVSFDTSPVASDLVNPTDIELARRALPVPVSIEDVEIARRAAPMPGATYAPAPMQGPPMPADVTRTMIPGRETLMRDRPPPPSLEPAPIGQETLFDRPPPPSLAETGIGAAQPGAVVNVPGRPVPVPEVQGLPMPPPPDPNAAIMPAATGADLPANAPVPPAQVMPGQQPNTVAVTNPKTGSTVVMTNDDYQALATYFAANATGAGDLSAGVGKMAGQIGLEFGNRADQDAMRAAGILYTGGYPGEKDVLPGQPAAPADTSPFKGDAEKIQYQKILNSTAERIRNKQPITPDEAYAFAQSYTEMTKPSPELRSGPNGSVVSIMVPGIVAPGTPTVAEVFAAAGLPPPPAAAAPAAPAASAAVAGGGGGGGGTVVAGGGDTVTAGGGGTAAVPATQESPWGVKIVVPGSPEKMTENQNLAAQYYSVGSAVEPELRKLRTGNLPAAWKVYASDEDIMGAILNKGFAKIIKNKVMQGDTQLQGYLTNAKNFAAAILRRESGAAVGENELSQVFDRYIPQPGDTDETIAMKAAYRAVALEALRQGAIGEKPRSFEELDQRIQEVMRASNLDFAVPSSAAQAQAKPRRRKLVDGKLVDVEG